MRINVYSQELTMNCCPKCKGTEGYTYCIHGTESGEWGKVPDDTFYERRGNTAQCVECGHRVKIADACGFDD